MESHGEEGERENGEAASLRVVLQGRSGNVGQHASLTHILIVSEFTLKQSKGFRIVFIFSNFD